jgi:hypothetical protein
MDFSFPRSGFELADVETALLKLEEEIESESVSLVLTPMLGEMLAEVTYSGNQGIVQHVYGVVQRWIMGKDGRVVWFNQPPAPGSNHPLPPCSTKGNVSVWADEAKGISDALALSEAPFGAISALCVRATIGATPCEAWSADDSRIRLCGLEDALKGPEAYQYVVDPDASKRSPSLASLRLNYKLIGGQGLRKSKRAGSHTQHLEFAAGRSWPLDVNYDPISGASMISLEKCSRLPAAYIRSALNTGQAPAAVSWLELSGVAPISFG